MLSPRHGLGLGRRRDDGRFAVLVRLRRRLVARRRGSRLPAGRRRVRGHGPWNAVPARIDVGRWPRSLPAARHAARPRPPTQAAPPLGGGPQPRHMPGAGRWGFPGARPRRPQKGRLLVCADIARVGLCSSSTLRSISVGLLRRRRAPAFQSRPRASRRNVVLAQRRRRRFRCPSRGRRPRCRPWRPAARRPPPVAPRGAAGAVDAGRICGGSVHHRRVDPRRGRPVGEVGGELPLAGGGCRGRRPPGASGLSPRWRRLLLRLAECRRCCRRSPCCGARLRGA